MENLSMDIVDYCILPYLNPFIRMKVSKHQYNIVNKNVEIIQNAWKNFKNKREIIEDEMTFNINFENTIDYQDLIVWFRYTIYNNKYEQKYISEYIEFLINKLEGADEKTPTQINMLRRYYSQCKECKNRHYVCLFLGLASDILSVKDILFVGF